MDQFWSFDGPICVFRHCSLGCRPKLQTHVSFVPGDFLCVVCVGTARGSRLGTLSILGDDRGTLQGQMCTERDPQGLVNSAFERAVVPRHPSLSDLW